MEKIQHLFLTGEKKAGKSTLLRKALDALDLHPAGFETRPYQISGRFMGFCMHATGPLPEGYENDNPISVLPMPCSPVPIPAIFDGFGADLLTAAREAGPLILMDELGSLERNAYRFQEAVRTCLDSPCHVVGVLKKCDQEMIRRIAAREDTVVFTVTPENRERLLPQLLEILRQFQQDPPTTVNG